MGGRRCWWNYEVSAIWIYTFSLFSLLYVGGKNVWLFLTLSYLLDECSVNDLNIVLNSKIKCRLNLKDISIPMKSARTAINCFDVLYSFQFCTYLQIARRASSRNCKTSKSTSCFITKAWRSINKVPTKLFFTFLLPNFL